MAGDLQAYWRSVKATEDTLPDGEVLLVMSLDNAEKGSVGGQVVEVGRAQAARLIVGRTHRIAKPEEIKKHTEREAAARAAILAEEHKRKQLYALPDELNQLVKAALLKPDKEGK